MKVTLDISFYPLSSEYEEDIIDFILRLREHEEIDLVTNGMSTQVFGNYSDTMKIVSEEMEASLLEKKAVFVLKVSGGERRSENLPEILKP